MKLLHTILFLLVTAGIYAQTPKQESSTRHPESSIQHPAFDKLYQTYQRFSDEGNKLEIRALNKGQDYYFAIEAFNENGVSSCSAPVYCK